jgi:hypothetical protein
MGNRFMKQSGPLLSQATSKSNSFRQGSELVEGGASCHCNTTGPYHAQTVNSDAFNFLATECYFQKGSPWVKRVATHEMELVLCCGE